MAPPGLTLAPLQLRRPAPRRATPFLGGMSTRGCTATLPPFWLGASSRDGRLTPAQMGNAR
jgi:hypothetical protein